VSPHPPARLFGECYKLSQWAPGENPSSIKFYSVFSVLQVVSLLYFQPIQGKNKLGDTARQQMKKNVPSPNDP